MTPESRTQFEQYKKSTTSMAGICARFDDGRYKYVEGEWEVWQACWSLKEKEVETLNDMLTSRDERLRSADAYFVNTALEVVELREQLTALKERV